MAVNWLVRPKCGACTNYVPGGGATCTALRFTWLVLGLKPGLFMATVTGPWEASPKPDSVTDNGE